MRCTFCATGKGGFARNLGAHEIVDQVLTVQERFGKRVSNVGECRGADACAVRVWGGVAWGWRGPGCTWKVPVRS